MFRMFDKVRNNEVYVIAEMSANHGGNLENALAIVREAAKAGADCLKIQTYTADTMTIDCDNDYFKIKGGLWDGYNLYELYKEAYTPWEWQPEIKKECELNGMDFLSTPFDKSAVDFLDKMGCEAYKIASFELVDIPLIEYTAAKHKPMIISCGMGSLEEIQDALDACRRMGNEDIVLLKCCSEYPANWSDMHLLNIPDMKKRFGVNVGLSDHSMGSVGAVAGVTLGACVVEKHICISRDMPSPDSAFSMEIGEFADMVNDIKKVKLMLQGPDYTLTKGEQASVAFRRSIFAVADIKKGEVYSEDNLRCIRPSNGMKPKFLKDLIGKTADRDYLKGTPIEEEHQLKKDYKFKYEDLTFRTITLDDTDKIVIWRSDKDIIKYFYNSKPVTRESHIKWFNEIYMKTNTRFDFMVLEKDKPIGFTALLDIDYDAKSAEISCTIGDKGARGKGTGVKMLSAMIDFGNTELGIKQIIAGIRKDNMPSIKMVTSVGFERLENSQDDEKEFLKYIRRI